MHCRCGVAGANSLDGSIFMTETNYKNFEVGREPGDGKKSSSMQISMDVI